YAEPLRQLLAHGTRLERAAPVEGAAAAFGAAVYPIALIAARAEPAPHDQVAAALGPTSAAPRVPQRLLQSGGPWILSPQASRVAGRLRDRFPALGDRWAAGIPARARRGTCSAPRGRTRRTASSGQTSPAGSRQRCRARRSCRSTPCTASPRGRPTTLMRSLRFSTPAG